MCKINIHRHGIKFDKYFFYFNKVIVNLLINKKDESVNKLTSSMFIA